MELFGTIWESLQAHVGPYLALYVADNRQGRLEDADRLPYTLDFLVIEELDYIQTLMGSITVKRELEAQIAPEKLSNGTFNETWIAQIMTILVGFSQITQEDEGLWDFDVNVFLSEETSETANYSPRNACSYLVQKLCRYPVLDSLLAHTKAIYEDRSSRCVTQIRIFVHSGGLIIMDSARTKEAAIFVLKQILDELDSCSKDIDPNIARAYLHYIGLAMHESTFEFLHCSVPRGWHATRRFQVVILANGFQTTISCVHEGISSYLG